MANKSDSFSRWTLWRQACRAAKRKFECGDDESEIDEYPGEEQLTTEVDIVASSWIHGNDKLCWWPGSHYTSTMAEKMAKNKVEVSDPSEWNAYDIKILYRHDDYLKARQKCRLAEDVSNLETETEPEAQEGRGKRKRKRINIDFESEDEERQSRKNLPKPPAPPKPPAVPIIRSHQATSSTTSSHFHNTSNTVTIITRHPSAPIGHIIHPFAPPTHPKRNRI